MSPPEHVIANQFFIPPDEAAYGMDGQVVPGPTNVLVYVNPDQKGYILHDLSQNIRIIIEGSLEASVRPYTPPAEDT